MNLSLQQKQLIDSHFHENIHESDLNTDVFSQLNSAEELHYLAQQHNWDNGVKVLQWIVESPLCSEATALELFWLAQPQDFQNTKLDKDVKNPYKNEVFSLIKTILANYSQHFYLKIEIHFDPKPYYESHYVVPNFMKEATIGEESYIYYDKTDIEWWFENDWKNYINRATTSIELFNIAYYMDEPEYADWILEHPLCDRGIATLVFWRMYNNCSSHVATPKKLAEIENKIKKNIYPEILAYDPNTDAKVKINSKKIVWEIPEIMKQAV